MDALGPHFQIEVNKFKFLNELVRKKINNLKSLLILLKNFRFV